MQTLENNEVKMQFPNEVTTGTHNVEAKALSNDVIETSRDLNNVFESAANVHKLVRTHYVDMATGTYGIESLIASILIANNAFFPLGIEKGEHREIALANAMTSDSIVEKVISKFGNERYPKQTIRNYLSTYMMKKGKVGKIQMTTKEDKNWQSESRKPRCKFYMVEKLAIVTQ